MSDSSSSQTNAPAQGKKERSPSFPFIGLPKALERARELYEHAKKHEARVADVAAAWGLGPKSSATLQTVSALLAFGLVEDQGSGEARKVKISDLGFRALEDQRPGAREKALRDAAMRPKLFLEYAERWADGRPSDGICISELRIDRGFTEDGARSFLRVYDDTMEFAKLSAADSASDKVTESVNDAGATQEIKAGDFVQWKANGVDQFKSPRKVIEILPGGMSVRVFGIQTEIPVKELEVVETNVQPQAKPAWNPVSDAIYSAAQSTPKNDISVLLRGNRLEIIADVDSDGLKTLRDMLEKYGEILNILK